MPTPIRGQSGTLLGKYRLSAVTGITTGMGASSAFFAARFNPAAQVRALIAELRLKAQILTPFTAANEISCAAYIGRSFTANFTGGTAIAPTGIQNMLSSISDVNLLTNFNDIRVATTGTLGSGTVTLDPSAFLTLLANQPLAAASAADNGISETIYAPRLDVNQGINLQSGEGIVVQLLNAAQGAAGTVRYAVEMEWYEYAAVAGGAAG